MEHFSLVLVEKVCNSKCFDQLCFLKRGTKYRCILSRIGKVKGCSALTAIHLLIAACTKCQDEIDGLRI